MSDSSTILKQFPLDFQWPTQEPFLFCVHHEDLYPRGNGQLGVPAKQLNGRNLGQDFSAKDGFRMYHGDDIPGFPVHPHRGFETITIVRRGYVDHADSMGAAGRYGEGDVQWMTAGAGIQHSEMFPLLETEKENTTDLFQIWLNLPRKSKMAAPAFKMFWSEQIPKIKLAEEAGEVSVIAGEFNGARAISPPPDSWASQSMSEALILLIKLNSKAELEIPKATGHPARSLYFYGGQNLSLNGIEISNNTGLNVDSRVPLKLTAVNGPAEILILQAKPIGEPVVQYGPFVMNSKAEIMQTMEDFQRTQFGGWMWDRHDMVHGPAIERFAKYPDGRIEKPGS